MKLSYRCRGLGAQSPRFERLTENLGGQDTNRSIGKVILKIDMLTRVAHSACTHCFGRGTSYGLHSTVKKLRYP